MTRLMIMVLFSFVFSACAGTPMTDEQLQQTPNLRLRKLEAAVAALERHPLAERVSTEISTARSFLQSASSLMATGEDADIELALSVAAGQTVLVKSALSRLDAQLGLESTRLKYEQTSAEIQKLRDANDAVLEQEKINE